MQYESTKTIESRVLPGVRFTIARMSFGRRLDLTRRVRQAGERMEFHRAGESLLDKLDAAVAASEMDRLYLEWALARVEGLEVDGKAADAAAVIDAGPEGLCREIVAEIRRECALGEEERKN
jgi:hypothetical protein